MNTQTASPSVFVDRREHMSGSVSYRYITGDGQIPVDVTVYPPARTAGAYPTTHHRVEFRCWGGPAKLLRAAAAWLREAGDTANAENWPGLDAVTFTSPEHTDGDSVLTIWYQD